MRYLIVLILILRFLVPEAFSQYISIRDNVFDTTTEEYTRNSPTNTIGNSRFGRGTRDTFFTKFYYNRVHFMRYNSSRNDGTPTNILWANDTGMIMKSSLSSLGIPDTSSLSNRINLRVKYSDTASMLSSYYLASNPNNYITASSITWANILGKPTTLSGYGITDPVVVTSGSYSDPSWITSLSYSKLTGTPTIPAAQVNSDWNSVSGVSQILNKPTIPTNTNQLTNGAGFLTSESDPIYTSGIVNYYTKTQADARYLQSYIETDPQFNTKFATKTTTDLAEGINLYYTSTRFNTAFSGKSTTDLTEGSNLYFTNSRARSSLSAGTGISYNSSTGVITNSSPDQTVAISSGTGISVTGTYPSFTITNTSPSTAALYDKTGLLSNNYVAFTDTFAITSATQTISLASYMSTAGKSNMRIKAVTGVRITGSPTAQGSPQVSISAITSNSITVVCTQANPATVTILGINVLSGLPLVLLSDFTATKVVIDAVFY